MFPVLPTPAHSRRQFLAQAGGGMGAVVLASLFSESAFSSPAPSPQPPAPQRVKRVIWLFMHGGPSHVDLLDPKPELIKLAGKPLPESFGPVMTRRKVAQNPLLGPIKPFQ